MKKVVLWGCIALSAVILVASYYPRGDSVATLEDSPAAVPEWATLPAQSPRTSRENGRGFLIQLPPEYVPAPMPKENSAATTDDTASERAYIADFFAAVQGATQFAVHRERVNERIEELSRESLAESFIRLQDNQTYVPESLLSGAIGKVTDLQVMFSNRGFLKVFQQFKDLPHEEALDKLNKFSRWAIDSLEAKMRSMRYEEAVPFGNGLAVPSSCAEAQVFSSYLVYTSMILAAYLGENALIIHQLDEVQRIIDECIDRVHRSDTIPPDLKDSVSQAIGVLDENTLLSILIYAAERTGIDLSEADIPFDALTKEVIPLFPWDAEWTHFDFPVHRGGIWLDPNDADELFTVYRFPHSRSNFRLASQELQEAFKVFFDAQDAIIDTLKEILSR